MSLRYAILHHTGIDEPHYDLLFETAAGSQLATWRSESWPIEQYGRVIRLKDHRRIFLDYEGEITSGRGMVIRLAGGDCEAHIESIRKQSFDLLNGVAPQRLSFTQLQGEQWECFVTALE